MRYCYFSKAISVYGCTTCLSADPLYGWLSNYTKATCWFNLYSPFKQEKVTLAGSFTPLQSANISPLTCPPPPFFFSLPFRYPRQPGGEGAPAHGHDWPVEQPEGAASGGARGAEEAGRLTNGEAEAADGAGQAAAGPGRGAHCM